MSRREQRRRWKQRRRKRERELERSQMFTCHRHRPFPTAKAAQAHYLAEARAGRADPGQVVYRCRRCQQWHHGGAGARSLGRLIEESTHEHV